MCDEERIWHFGDVGHVFGHCREREGDKLELAKVLVRS
jgi:hypothetical protein